LRSYHAAPSSANKGDDKEPFPELADKDSQKVNALEHTLHVLKRSLQTASQHPMIRFLKDSPYEVGHAATQQQRRGLQGTSGMPGRHFN
jgi:hypothetical protein